VRQHRSVAASAGNLAPLILVLTVVFGASAVHAAGQDDSVTPSQMAQQMQQKSRSSASAQATASASSNSEKSTHGCQARADARAEATADGRRVVEHRHDEAAGDGACRASSSARATTRPAD
jgi:hypothetical protein